MSNDSKRFHPELFSLRHFRHIFDDIQPMLPTESDLRGVVGSEHSPRLLLDYYSDDMIVERLEQHGLLDKLRSRGFSNLKVTLNVADPLRQQVAIYFDKTDFSHLLAEICLHAGTFSPHSKIAGPLRRKKFSMLYILWLRLQNPAAPFVATRPALPGQIYPGLKIGRDVMQILVILAERLNFEGIINVPEFPHAAVLYSEAFRFFDPISEGRLMAIKRDMDNQILAESSWGIHLGCVRNRETGESLDWFREEQVLPLSKSWKEYFSNPRYLEIANDVFESTHYEFDEVKWRQLYPLNLDGSPHSKYRINDER